MDRKKRVLRIVIIIHLLLVIGFGTVSADSVCIESSSTVMCCMTELDDCACNTPMIRLGPEEDCCTIQQRIKIEADKDFFLDVDRQILFIAVWTILPQKPVLLSLVPRNNPVRFFPPPPLESVKFLC